MLNCCPHWLYMLILLLVLLLQRSPHIQSSFRKKPHHGLLLRSAENPPATFMSTACSFTVGAILRTWHWSVTLSSSFMVRGQQSTLPAVSPPPLPPAHCSPAVATAAGCVQRNFFLPQGALTSHWPTVASRYCAHPWSALTSLKRCKQNTVLLVYKKFSWFTVKCRLPQKMCQPRSTFLWKEKYLSKYKIYTHTVLSHPYFFAGFTVLNFYS